MLVKKGFPKVVVIIIEKPRNVLHMGEYDFKIGSKGESYYVALRILT